MSEITTGPRSSRLAFGGPTVELPEFVGRVQRTAADHALLELVDALRLTASTGGVRLPRLNEIARAVHVSPSNVREALKVLERAGVVEVSPGRGGGVFILTLGNIPRAVASLYPPVPEEETEMLLEAMYSTERAIAHLATARATESDIRTVEQRLGDIEQGSAADIMDYNERTVRFQISMATVARNSFLRGQFTELMNRVSFTVSLSGDPQRIPAYRVDESKALYRRLVRAFIEKNYEELDEIIETRHAIQRELRDDIR